LESIPNGLSYIAELLSGLILSLLLWKGRIASILTGILGAETSDHVSGVPELDATIKRGSIPLSSFMFYRRRWNVNVPI